MKWMLALFGAVLTGLLIAVDRTGKWDALWASARRTGVGLVPVLVIAVLVAACVDVLAPGEFIKRSLGEVSGIRGVLTAWLAGVLTPGGGPIGLPLVATLARQGASVPVLLTYLLSMSTLSLIRLPMEWGLLGGRLMLLRYVSSFFIPPLVGLAALAAQRLR